MDLFLTQINSMPAKSQLKLMQEKMILMNEQFVNMYEELHNLQKFHTKLEGFFSQMRTEILTTDEVTISDDFKLKLDQNSQQALCQF